LDSTSSVTDPAVMPSAGSKTLLKGFHITHELPCLADPRKIRAIVELSDDIHEVLPYLNATLKGVIYNQQAGILTLKKDGAMITLYPAQVTLAKVDDRAHAQAMMVWLRGLINETYENRERIKPNYERGAVLRALDAFKLLPGTNCKRCGVPSCLAFAVKLVEEELNVMQCAPLFTPEYRDRRTRLLEMLAAVGLAVPTVFRK